MAVVLGISNTHNGSVALICNGEVKYAVQAERISRVKRQPLPLGEEIELTKRCVDYCLTASEMTLSDVDAVGLCTPWDVKTITDEKLFNYIGGSIEKYLGTSYVPHHFAHLEYILHYGHFKPGIALVIDGSGSHEKDRHLFNIPEACHTNLLKHAPLAGKEVISAYWFDGKNSSLVYRWSPSISKSPAYNSESNGKLQSIGHYWEWASLYCCGSSHEAGKVMGLAAFGNGESNPEDSFLEMSNDGSLKLDFPRLKAKYTSPNIFGYDLSSSIHHHKVAQRVQSDTEAVILQLLNMLKKKFPSDTLYLSGGVALNVVANEKIIQSNLFEEVILNGSVEDNGTAIGAGLAVHHNLGNKRKTSLVTDYYGRTYSDEDIKRALDTYQFSYEIFNYERIYQFVAQLIAQEKVIGWFQGRSEFGPRALGNRSILANPTSRATKYLLDSYMKYRDRYRPYAPVVIEEKASEYFNIKGTSPVMMRNVKVVGKNLPAITHIDGNARLQTVNKNDNIELYSLLLEVEKHIAVPILLNTSFNLPGEPIVETPADALSSFSRSGLDYLCLGRFLVSR
ncbi:hypothetical protein N8156_05310 [Rhodospirillaceae bacterium]|nr:hypothetical protein [Rhodospirillaceae bacterium]